MLLKAIECPLCKDGKKYFELNSHVRNKHKMQLQDFRKDYPAYACYTQNVNQYKNKRSVK